MYCEKCGQFVESESHGCSAAMEQVFPPKLNVMIPSPPHKSSPSYESSSIALAEQVPGDVTLEEIISRAPSALGVLKEIKTVISIWKNVVKKPTKENIILLVSGAIIFLLWVWTKYAPGAYSYMKPEGIKSVLAFLLGTFNNVPTRILHYSCLVTLLAAFVPAVIAGKSEKLIGNIKGTYALARKIISYKNSKTIYIAVVAFGAGMFFANFMMRNNSQNKYFACLTLGLTVLLSTSGLFDSTFIRLSKGLYDDILRVCKLQKYIAKYQIMIQMGFGSGLILSFLSCIVRGMRSTSFTDRFGYYLGTVIVIAGVVLIFAVPRKAAKTA